MDRGAHSLEQPRALGIMTALSISRTISLRAAEAPERPCITCGDVTVTRLAFDRATNRLARAYAARGVQAGTMVTIALPNGIRFYEAAVAVWKLGATPQPVSWRLPDHERRQVVELANPRLIVGVDPGAHPGYPSVPPDFEPDPALSDAELPDAIAPCWKAPTSGGSTGRPKLILSGRPGTVAAETGLLADFGRDGCHVVPGPLYHNAPFASSMQGLFRGNHLVVLPRFDAEATLQAVAQYRATFLLLVPTMMLRIWRLPEGIRLAYDMSSLRVVQHLAAPCPDWLKRAWIEWLGPQRIYELYAGVEAQAVCEIRGDDWLTHPGSVGPVRMGEMKIVGADGVEVPRGTIGEIYMRGSPQGNPSYSYRGASPRGIPGHWESLGDMGWMDCDGYVYLTDRRADMILVGGANVYPAEVENALQEHPQVQSCAVIGLPDAEFGNRVHAIVQASGVGVKELAAFMAQRLHPEKLPRSYEIVDWPVRDDAGKVRRSGLRAERGG